MEAVQAARHAQQHEAAAQWHFDSAFAKSNIDRGTKNLSAAAALKVGGPKPASDIEGMVEQVADFCNDPAASAAGHWNISMPLAPEVFPQSTLHVTLTPEQLNLRFEIRDKDAHRAISSQQQSLIGMLQDALKQPRQVCVALDPLNPP
jgi:hypothetical protein